MPDETPQRPLPPPRSPDSLDGGIRGRVTGVTRIGSRALFAGVVVIVGLLLAILYGINRRPPPIVQTPPQAGPSVAPDIASQHFGANIPLVTATPVPTPPPPLLLPPSPVPNIEAANASSHAASGPSAEDLAEQARESAQRAEEERRRALLEAALKAPILAQGSPQNGNGIIGGPPVQIAYAGNGDNPVASDVGYSPSVGGSSGNAGGGAAGTGGASGGGGGGAGAPQVVAQASPVPGGVNGAPGVPLGSSNTQTNAVSGGAQPFLNGPFGEYRVNGAGVTLPSGGRKEDFLNSQRFAPLTRYEVVASSVIPAALVTGIDSELPGVVTAIVRENVYDSKSGKYLLIPKGSRVIGLYNNQILFGQTRILVAWQRLIFPDTTSIDLLNMPASDVQGFSGVAGNVDNHFGTLFGAALLTSVLAAGVAVASGTQQATLLGATNVNIGQTVGQQVAQNVANIGTQITQKDLSVPPTLHVLKGYPFLVTVDRDIVFDGPYHGQ